jgi:hypothetical protein
METQGMVPAPALALAAGRVRREQQLRQRGSQARPQVPDGNARSRPASHTAGAPDAELLRALRRIVGRPA